MGTKFEVIARTLYIGYVPETKFDLCDFIDLENQGYNSKSIGYSEGPMCQIDSCQTFRDIASKWVSLDR